MRMAKGKERPTKEELERLYNGQRLPISRIAEQYGVSSRTIGNWMENDGITRRTISESKLPKGFQKPSKQELDLLYNKQGLSTTQIAEQYGVSAMTILSWMDEHNIKRKNNSESKLPKGFQKPSKQELTDLHDSGLSIEKIATKYGTSAKYIARIFDEFKIKRKKISVKQGQWKSLEFVLEQAKIFLQENPQYQELPSGRILIEKKYHGLISSIIKYHGGITLFRQALNTHLKRTPTNEQPSLLEQYVGGNRTS